MEVLNEAALRRCKNQGPLAAQRTPRHRDHANIFFTKDKDNTRRFP